MHHELIEEFRQYLESAQNAESIPYTASYWERLAFWNFWNGRADA